jgi:hypothetical protein
MQGREIQVVLLIIKLRQVEQSWNWTYYLVCGVISIGEKYNLKWEGVSVSATHIVTVQLGDGY